MNDELKASGFKFIIHHSAFITSYDRPTAFDIRGVRARGGARERRARRAFGAGGLADAGERVHARVGRCLPRVPARIGRGRRAHRAIDRKSTRLNSSHANISYAVFCLKKKKNK